MAFICEGLLAGCVLKRDPKNHFEDTARFVQEQLRKQEPKIIAQVSNTQPVTYFSFIARHESQLEALTGGIRSPECQ